MARIVKIALKKIIQMIPFLDIVEVKVAAPVYAKYYVFFQNHCLYPINHRETRFSKEGLLYFKVNRIAEYTFECIQKWIDVAKILDRDFCFVCDNTKLQKMILERNSFYNEKIIFIKSEKKALKNVVMATTSKRWANAGYAHLTPFYYSDKYNTSSFWAIDADDIMYCVDAQSVARILSKAEIYADCKDYSVFSTDIWYSRTLGKHWTWGVAYVRNNINWKSIFYETKDKSWIEAGTNKYCISDTETNMDWFFTYLWKEKGIKAGTFYVENMKMIHFGQFLNYPHMVACIYYFKQKHVEYPIVRYVFDDIKHGYLSVPSDSVMIDIGLGDSDSTKYMRGHFNNFCK